MKKVIYIAIAFLSILVIIGAWNNKIKGYNEEIQEKIESIEIVETHKELNENIYYIKGKIKNISDKEVNHINITFTLYSENNELMGYCYDMQENIESGETREISGTITGAIKNSEEVDHWEIEISSM